MPLIPSRELDEQRRGASPAEVSSAIPTGYGDDRIVLMVKDPWWLYAYWEIQPSTERAVRSRLQPHEAAGLQSILRVFDVTDLDYPAQPARRFFDIQLSGLATNWFIHTNAPNRAFLVEIGLLTAGGRFLLLARSNPVRAPRFGPSDVIDEEWRISDEMYWKLFGSSLAVGSSPGGWAQGLTQQLFSGQWASGGLVGFSRQSAVRGFWCRVNTDVVIHGATEPRARVSIQGQPVAIRKDGTFSLRLALPEGTQTVTIEVTSADGQRTKTMTPLVSLAWAGPLASGEVPKRPATRPRGAREETPGAPKAMPPGPQPSASP